jgi:hypothetical protein
MGYLVGTPHFTVTSGTKHRDTLNYETGFILRVMQVLHMTDSPSEKNSNY